MPRFLAPITVGQETVTGTETISGNQIILSGTYGKDSYWTSVSASDGLSADHGSFVNNVSASSFYGDGSHLTGITGLTGDYLPLSGGVMTGPINFGYSYGPRIDQGRYDSSRGGLSGISLVCSVDYDLNWQAGWITSFQQDRITPMPLYIDSGAGTTLRIWNGAYVGAGSGVEISHNGIQFPDNTIQNTAALPLSGGTLTGGITGTTAAFTTSLSSPSLSGTHYGDGSHLTNLTLTNLNADNITSGTLSAARLPAFTGDITTTVGSSSATVIKIQNYPISTQTPSTGQMLQWSGTAWVPGTVPTGGSGGGGVVYYLNYGTAGDPPIAGLSGTAYELGKVSTPVLSSATLTNVSQTNWDTVATFVTDNLDPEVTVIAAGIFDLNFWASSTASIQTQMTVRYLLYTYNDTLSTTTLIATSDTYNIYDPAVVAQYVLSMIVPQTTINIDNRLFLVLQARSASPNKDITVYFNNGRPTHLHTTIPSVGGTGLVKVINGIYQSPASLLVNTDVASNAAISQSKIENLTTDLNSKFDKAGGTLTGGITGTTAQFSGAVYGSTATAGASSTQLATTAFVHDNVNTGLASGSAIASTVVALVTNADSVALTRGTVVYSYGSQGDRVSVRRASASDESTSSKTLGFVNETIAVGQIGHVTLYGSMDKLDLGSPFVAGDALWLGTTPGTYTRVKPQAPTHLVYLGVVQRANAGNGTAYIKVQNGYELNEIHDVLIVNPSARDIIQRNSDNTLWVSTSAYFLDSEIASSSKWNSTTTTVSSNSGRWESVYTTVNSNSSTYVTLTATQTLKNKTVIDWMTLVRGYNTTPTLLATIGTGDVYTYIYNSSPSNITYYRYIATDGSEDSFYTYFSGTSLSGLVASKSITL